MTEVADQSSPRTRRWSYSLKTLLVVVTVCAVAIGAIANRSQRRQFALRIIREVGGDVSSERDFRHSMLNKRRHLLVPAGHLSPNRTSIERIFGDWQRSVNYLRRPLPLEARDAIATLFELRRLNLCDSTVTDDDLRAWSDLDRLEYLNLTGTAVTDSSIVVLEGFSEMRWLELNRTNVTDHSVPSLMELRNLEVLRIKDTKITEHGILQLASLKNLREIHIGHSDRTSSTLPADILKTLHERHPSLQVSNQ